MERNRLKEALIIAIKGERAVCGLETCDDHQCNLLTELMKNGYAEGETWGSVNLTFQGQLAKKALGL